MTPFAIFDLDGTLLNTLEDIADALNLTLCKYGFPPHPLDSYKYFVGSGVINLIRTALPENIRNDETVLMLKKDYEQYYTAHSQDKTKPYPGIVDMLKSLISQGLKLAVLSNKPHASTCFLVDAYFPGIFDMVLGQRDGVPHKPDPSAVLEIIGSLNLAGSQGFYIGDTSTDMLTGKTRGFIPLGFLGGFAQKPSLLQAELM